MFDVSPVQSAGGAARRHYKYSVNCPACAELVEPVEGPLLPFFITFHSLF
jgi:hypothetical protein